MCESESNDDYSTFTSDKCVSLPGVAVKILRDTGAKLSFDCETILFSSDTNIGNWWPEQKMELACGLVSGDVAV